MNFRLTTGQTSGEKKFEKNFIASKEPLSNCRESWGVNLLIETIFWSKSPKNTLLSFKRQKRTQLLKWFFQTACLNNLNPRLHIGYSRVVILFEFERINISGALLNRKIEVKYTVK